MGPRTASATIPALPASAPAFGLNIGRVYEDFIFHFYICTSTLVVRRKEAGDAFRFPENVKMFEDYECFARLASRGLGAYMDCDTEWNHGHAGWRLTDADQVSQSDALIRITGRVWGADEEYLRLHRKEYEIAVDRRRLQKVRYLLGLGRRYEARQELAKCYQAPSFHAPATYAPGWLMGAYATQRRRLLKLGEAETATGPTWKVVEYRGRPGLEQLEVDWRRLYDDMPKTSRYHAYESHLAYLDHLCEAPALSRYLALTDGQRVRAICPPEARQDTSLGMSIPVWGVPLNSHWVVTDVVCPEDEARRVLTPALLAHLRKAPEGRALLALGALCSSTQ